LDQLAGAADSIDEMACRINEVAITNGPISGLEEYGRLLEGGW
jgi:hypothetical protein